MVMAAGEGVVSMAGEDLAAFMVEGSAGVAFVAAGLADMVAAFMEVEDFIAGVMAALAFILVLGSAHGFLALRAISPLIIGPQPSLNLPSRPFILNKAVLTKPTLSRDGSFVKVRRAIIPM